MREWKYSKRNNTNAEKMQTSKKRKIKTEKNCSETKGWISIQTIPVVSVFLYYVVFAFCSQIPCVC